MRKKTRTSLILIILVVIVAVGAWYFFFRSSSKTEDANSNTNQAEDLGYDSLLDTGDISVIDPATAVDEIDMVISDYAQPDATLDIDLKK